MHANPEVSAYVVGQLPDSSVPSLVGGVQDGRYQVRALSVEPVKCRHRAVKNRYATRVSPHAKSYRLGIRDLSGSVRVMKKVLIEAVECGSPFGGGVLHTGTIGSVLPEEVMKGVPGMSLPLHEVRLGEPIKHSRHLLR
jgi:hypothetical protein